MDSRTSRSLYARPTFKESPLLAVRRHFEYAEPRCTNAHLPLTIRTGLYPAAHTGPHESLFFCQALIAVQGIVPCRRPCIVHIVPWIVGSQPPLCMSLHEDLKHTIADFLTVTSGDYLHFICIRHGF
jgi:hypothetical protein